jgi:hypothetical protein
MSEHTPAPWHVRTNPIRDDEPRDVVNTSQLIAEVREFYSAGEREANARLIAAAPELLEVLLEARAELSRVQYDVVRSVQANNTPEMQALVDRLDAAIAKALGQQVNIGEE